MNAMLAALAVLCSALALYLPTRVQTFTRVTLEGRTLRMLVAGDGGLTVVFESGAGAPLEMWGKVQPAVSRFAKTVSYDRAGLGVSDPGRLPRDGRRIAGELGRALRSAGIMPPYILVGASLGGPFARIFAGMYPDDVAGMVLVDPTPDRERFNSTAPELLAWEATREQARLSTVRPGVPVFLIDAVSPVEVPFVSERLRTVRRNARADIEAESIEHKAWLQTVPGGRLIVTHDSGHNVPIEQPSIVIDAIRQMVDQVRARLY
jgi:pimeloyl-ACP methyl ester carboxylesterase